MKHLCCYKSRIKRAPFPNCHFKYQKKVIKWKYDAFKSTKLRKMTKNTIIEVSLLSTCLLIYHQQPFGAIIVIQEVTSHHYYTPVFL